MKKDMRLARMAAVLACALTLAVAGCSSSSDKSDGLRSNKGPVVQDGVFAVPGQANVFAADLDELPLMTGGAGVLPPTFTFEPGPGKIMTITTATGLADCCSGTAPADPPDGGTRFGRTNLTPFQDLSGIVFPGNTMFVSAVFTNGRDSAATPPENIDYSAVDPETTVEYFPLINQLFFVGDGVTADGTRQSFFVPETATAVSFGVADGFAFNGTPGAYDDNTGGWELSIRLE